MSCIFVIQGIIYINEVIGYCQARVLILITVPHEVLAHFYSKKHVKSWGLSKKTVKWAYLIRPCERYK